MLDNKKINNRLLEKFGTSILGTEENFGELSIFAKKEDNLKIFQFLYDDSELEFKFLVDLTAIHYPEKKGEELTVTYLVKNLYKNITVRLNFSLDIKKPEIFTLSKLFLASNWLERECFDFFGVKFIGHPNLKRIMNVDEMDYHPLRKEYTLEDPTRKDKDDEMFGRGGNIKYKNS